MFFLKTSVQIEFLINESKNFRFPICIFQLMVGSAITYVQIPSGIQKVWTPRVHLTLAIENNRVFSIYN